MRGAWGRGSGLALLAGLISWPLRCAPGACGPAERAVSLTKRLLLRRGEISPPAGAQLSSLQLGARGLGEPPRDVGFLEIQGVRGVWST